MIVHARGLGFVHLLHSVVMLHVRKFPVKGLNKG